MQPVRFRLRAAFVAAVVVAAGAVSAPAHAATACEVTYTTNDWNTGFTANVTLKNLGDPLTSWNLGWAFPNAGQRATQGWSATIAQTGSQVTATNAAWNGSVPRGGSVSFGFNGTHTGQNPAPASFTLNGTTCAGDVVAPTLVATPASVTVPEAGSSTFTVTTSVAPTGTVPVTLTRAGDASISVTPATATLTPANWNTGVRVTVAAAADDDTVSGSATVTAAASGYPSLAVPVTELDDDTPSSDNTYVTRFLEQYRKIKSSGYFSAQGVPYHSIETLIVEAPDHGHETTSEAFSFWIWLEAQYGRVTQDWAPFNRAWAVMEQYIIPSHADQPTAGVNGTPQYAAEYNRPDQYPSSLQPDVPVGQDPLRSELQSAYGTGDIYGMHWLLDVDNTYGFGRCGDGTTKPAYINTFQRGPQESVWETVPQPSCDTFEHGGPNGFLDLSIKDTGAPAKQWKYTNAPDADARAVQAAYWAVTWAKEQNKLADIAPTVAKAAKMGDYLRYAMFDKYFKKIGNCVGATACPAGSGKDSAHYLMSWYYAWGGATDPAAGWSWRIGSSHAHFGYQNPFAAWALTNTPELTTAMKSPSASADWAKSLTRQLEFYTWLQSAKGAIAGGATNSWDGAYGTPPAGTPTFYGMPYTEHPPPARGSTSRRAGRARCPTATRSGPG